MAVLRVHTSILSAAALLAIGEKQISVKWNETSKQSKREVSVLIPFESVSAPEVPESFRILVESALVSSAKDVLKSFVEQNPNSFELDSSLFDRDVLTQNFLASGSTWMKKEELEIAFTGSATWKRIASRPEFQNNKTYQAVANRFKDTILKLSGKVTQIPADDCDKILCKLEDSDLSTPFGEFVVSRLEQMKAKISQEVDFDSL
jgi:hypothetical protein